MAGCARGEILDACLVGEPTSARALGDMIKIGRRGSMTGRLTAHGVQGHTAYPHLRRQRGAPPRRAAARADHRPSSTAGTEHFQPSSLQVSTIDIGNPATRTSIPASAQAAFNIRFNDRWTSDDAESAGSPSGSTAVGGRYTLDLGGQRRSRFWCRPARSATASPRRSAAVTGRTPNSAPPAAPRMRRFIQAYCPVAEFGLVGLTMHKIDERVELDRPRRA